VALLAVGSSAGTSTAPGTAIASAMASGTAVGIFYCARRECGGIGRGELRDKHGFRRRRGRCGRGPEHELRLYDRIFRTLHPAHEIDRFGVGDLPGEMSLGLIDQLATPWRLPRSEPAWPDQADIALREIEGHRIRYWQMFR
jgi:hypothetical protein